MKSIKEKNLEHFGYGKKRQTWDEGMLDEVKIIEKTTDLTLEEVEKIISGFECAVFTSNNNQIDYIKISNFKFHLRQLKQKLRGDS